MAIKEKLGVSIIGKLEGVTETFVESEIRYLEFRIVKDDYDEIDERVALSLRRRKRAGLSPAPYICPKRAVLICPSRMRI